MLVQLDEVYVVSDEWQKCDLFGATIKIHFLCSVQNQTQDRDKNRKNSTIRLALHPY